jgi:glutaredoxin-related protein
MLGGYRSAIGTHPPENHMTGQKNRALEYRYEFVNILKKVAQTREFLTARKLYRHLCCLQTQTSPQKNPDC